MKYPSVIFEKAIEHFTKLPGVGKKTALRFVLHLLKKNDLTSFLSSLEDLQNKIHFCQKCHNVSDDLLCGICSDTSRRASLLCVVENIRDVIAIESTEQFKGVYHILGGLISPLDGVGPAELTIDNLLKRIAEEDFEEIIFALNPTMQGDTTIYYIQKMLPDTSIKITSIARGVAFGGELEYADDLTLARSLASRLPIENYVKQ